MNADGSVSEIKDALNATLGVALPVGTGLIPETTSPWLAPKVGPVGQNGLGMGLFIGALIGILADATTDLTTPDDTGKPGHTYYHGTSVKSGLNLLNGAPLTLLPDEHIDGAPGFYLASDYYSTEYYALRRQPGVILQYDISHSALEMLLSSGASISPMPQVGTYSAPGIGSQLYVPPVSFMVFDMLRNSGQIIVTLPPRTE